jgi:hypothetical protein
VKLLHENHQEIRDGWGGHVKKERQFVVVPRFILDEMFGFMAVFFFKYFFLVGGGRCVWVARRVGYMSFLIHL